MYVCFFFFMLKVRYFKHTNKHRPFWTSEVTLSCTYYTLEAIFSIVGVQRLPTPASAEGASFLFRGRTFLL